MTVMEVQEKLENNGYEVIVAYDGNEALEKFIACKPDLIVLDVDMPGKDGLEVLQFIRLQDSQTPVIIYPPIPSASTTPPPPTSRSFRVLPPSAPPPANSSL